MSCFYLYRRVTSSMYSRHCEGNRSWRYQVVDISVFICGHMSLQVPVREALEGGRCVLEGLQFGDDPGSRIDECDWEVDKHNLLAMSSTPPSTSNFLPPIPLHLFIVHLVLLTCFQLLPLQFLLLCLQLFTPHLPVLTN